MTIYILVIPFCSSYCLLYAISDDDLYLEITSIIKKEPPFLSEALNDSFDSFPYNMEALKLEIESLKDENKSVKKQNSSLSNRLKDLDEENRGLVEENRKLKYYKTNHQCYKGDFNSLGAFILDFFCFGAASIYSNLSFGMFTWNIINALQYAAASSLLICGGMPRRFNLDRYDIPVFQGAGSALMVIVGLSSIGYFIACICRSVFEVVAINNKYKFNIDLYCSQEFDYAWNMATSHWRMM